jgi:nucleotide-binding universal stress UspA family protein
MKILVGYNGSAESKAAVALAGTLAKPLVASLIIVTSMEGGRRENPEEIAASRSHLAEARETMAASGIACEVFQTARGMSPGEDLVRIALDSQVDMIVVGVEKKSRTQKILLGSTAQYIILKAHCPVLTVK